MSGSVRSLVPLDAALAYAALGYHVFPVHEIGESGQCACGHPDCASPGKHPRTRDGHKSATTATAQIAGWWKKYPRANVGIATGAKSGCFVLDVDPRHGGGDALAGLEREHGTWPARVEAATGGGGTHFWFLMPDTGMRNRTGFRAGLDIRGEGGFVVVPPSNHKSGGRYEWKPGCAPGEYPLAPAPKWLLDAVGSSPVASAHVSAVLAQEPQRHVDAQPITIDQGRELLDRARAYAANVPPAEQGNRDNAAFKLAGNLRAIRVGDAPPTEEIIELVVREWAVRCTPPLDERTVSKCVRSSAVNGTPRAAKPDRSRGRTRASQALKRRATTDSGNAERFVDQCGERVRFCTSWKQWLVWNGIQWRIDDADEVLLMSKDVARSIYVEAGRLEDETARAAAAKWAVASERKERRRAMVDLAAVEDGIPISQDELDRDVDLLNVANGTFNLRTGDFRPHCSSDFITKLCPVVLDLAQDCPLWRKTLERVIPDDETREYFQRFCGYCLTGRVSEQVILIAYGDGSNGKSTIFRTIQDVLSTSYAIQIGTELLTQKSQRGHPTEIADLRGARIAVGTETGHDQELDEALLKLLTGGDRIRARRMRENFSEFAPTHKLVLITNHLPRLRGTDYAVRRRLHYLAFEVTIPVEERDPQLMEKLVAERAGILAWMIKGARDWFEIGLRPPADVLRNQIEPQKSVEACFVESALYRRIGHRLAKRRILDEFASVTGNNADSVMSRGLGRALGDAGYGSKKTGGVIVYLDIDFVSDSAPGNDGSGTLGTMGTLVGVEPLEISHEEKNIKQGPHGPQGPWSASDGHTDGVIDARSTLEMDPSEPSSTRCIEPTSTNFRRAEEMRDAS